MTRSDTLTADFVIVGAGSAGCVLANRLSADPNCQVVLLEAGGHDRRLSIRMPSAFYMPMNSPDLNWGYKTEPEKHLNHRRLDCPRGRVLGGSSAINGMVYIRGNAADFDRWEALGATDWNYANVLPYFKRAQQADARTDPDPYQGHDGPLKTTTGKMQNPLYETFLRATEQAGYTRRSDLNGAEQEGFGPFPMTTAGGQRMSSARAYLTPVRHRENLKVLSRTTVQKVNFDTQGSAVSVQARQGRQSITLQANREVILCAGAIGSPQLMMLSGLGNADDLRQSGIQVVADRPEIGRNLMDHLEVYVQQACLAPVSLYKHLSVPGKAMVGARWLLSRDGLGATNHFEVGGFISSTAEAPSPDIQFHFLPAAMSYDGQHQARQHGFQVHVGPTLSPSRGYMKLRDSRSTTPPLLQFNYMSHANDWETFRTAIRAARDIFAQGAFDEVRGPELAPGANATSDAALDAFIRAQVQSAYHPCGTCRMGSDADAVVDPQGRVQGVKGLRVVDASVFPHITNGNLNAPTIMLAERMADLIAGQPLLPAQAPAQQHA